VAEENARAAQVHDRYRTIAGDAFTAEFGTGDDEALVTNFSHHFDAPTCTALPAKVHGAVRSGGRVRRVRVRAESCSRVAALFSAIQLDAAGETPGGDTYTFGELRQQLEDAGFRNVSSHALPTPQTVLLAMK
jgi:hypothetical protein